MQIERYNSGPEEYIGEISNKKRSEAITPIVELKKDISHNFISLVC